MPLEFIRPERSQYKNDHEYQYAYGKAVAEYDRLCMQVIDRESCSKGCRANTRDNLQPKAAPKTGLERERYNLDSLHDFLADRPHLLARYKKFGLDGLL